MSFMQIDWRALVVPTVGLAELFIRGSVMYLGMLILMRLLRRQKGALNTADLLVLIVIADAAQNGMASEYTSLTEGLFLVGTIFLCMVSTFWRIDGPGSGVCCTSHRSH